MNIVFKNAAAMDAKALTEISIAAFHSDFIAAGRKTEGGPPGYDSVAFHKQMIEEASRFYKILFNDTIIGGFWFNKKSPENAYFSRIFLDPQFHCKGIGLLAFDFLFSAFPEIKTWSLKTPIWNTRSPKFYLKLGFKITEKSNRFLFFSRRTEPEKKGLPGYLGKTRRGIYES